MNVTEVFCLKGHEYEYSGEVLTFLPCWVNFAGTSNAYLSAGVYIPVKVKQRALAQGVASYLYLTAAITGTIARAHTQARTPSLREREGGGSRGRDVLTSL